MSDNEERGRARANLDCISSDWGSGRNAKGRAHGIPFFRLKNMTLEIKALKTDMSIKSCELIRWIILFSSLPNDGYGVPLIFI